MKQLPAVIKWQEFKQNKLPTSNKYCTVAKFEDDTNWQDEAWSIVVDFNTPPSEQGMECKGFVSFLSPLGPIEKLKSGIKFELYEGKELSAIVEIY